MKYRFAKAKIPSFPKGKQKSAQNSYIQATWHRPPMALTDDEP